MNVTIDYFLVFPVPPQPRLTVSIQKAQAFCEVTRFTGGPYRMTLPYEKLCPAGWGLAVCPSVLGYWVFGFLQCSCLLGQTTNAVGFTISSCSALVLTMICWQLMFPINDQLHTHTHTGIFFVRFVVPSRDLDVPMVNNSIQ